MEQLLTVKDIAKTLQCSVYQVYRLVGQKRIPHLRVAGGAIRFDPTAVTAWLKEQIVVTVVERAVKEGVEVTG